jgi:hypothetical protein
MYVVEIKDSAIEANPDLQSVIDDRDREISFQSKAEAEAFAADWSEAGTEVRIQKVAPQDPNDIDGYLAPNPQRSTHEPLQSDRQGLTFHTDANQYGDLGEALVMRSHGISPGVQYYLRENYDIGNKERYRIKKASEYWIPGHIDLPRYWRPDCTIAIKDTHDWEVVRKFYCEVKTGDASFQRGQRLVMQRVAEEYDVLKIRVIIEDLPDQYTLRINEVKPGD